MFEGILYFVLGFLAAALIALIVSPAIWTRAVVLTKRRIESSVPLTLNEIQADKDQLRAEFAMSTRRLEIAIEEMQEKASRQVIEINRKRDDLAKIASQSHEKIKMVEELETRSAELRSRLNEREEALSSTSKLLDTTKEELENKALALEGMEQKLGESQISEDSKRIELVASQTSLEDLQALEAQHKSELKTVSSENKEKEDRLVRLQKINSELEDKTLRTERELSELRKAGKLEDDTSRELAAQLMTEKSNTTKLEAKLAKVTLKMEAMLSDASNKNVQSAMKVLNTEKSSMEKQIKSLTSERDVLLKKTENQQTLNKSDWEQERKENAILRERINDLAAQVTSMTASLEGPDSKIYEILSDAEKTKKPKASSKKGKDTTQSSLADRIRALQETARLKQS